MGDDINGRYPLHNSPSCIKACIKRLTKLSNAISPTDFPKDSPPPCFLLDVSIVLTSFPGCIVAYYRVKNKKTIYANHGS